MKKTTQKLFKLSLEKLNYEDNKIIFGNYEIIHDYPRIIKKDGNQIWVVVNWEVYINSFFERFLFWRQVEKNLSNITEFLKKISLKNVNGESRTARKSWSFQK